MERLTFIPCEPPAWARSGHAQTILGHLLPSPRLREKGEAVEFPLEDGDRLVATYFPGASGTIVGVFHGLAGDTSADYMERTAALCRVLGHGAYLVNHRGCGPGEKTARRPYHSGRGEDISSVIAFARKRHPGKRFIAVGFSLSGNALLCLLTGLRGSSLPDAAISVNAPIDLAKCSVLLGTGWNRIYDRRFVARLTRNVKRRHALGLIDKRYVFPRRMTLRDFDDLFTAPEGGFASREDYYGRCSTRDHLHKITVPSVILTAADDPFVPVESYRNARISPTTQLHVEAYGGHMGYLTAKPTPLGTRRWLDYALDQSLRYLHGRL